MAEYKCPKCGKTYDKAGNCEKCGVKLKESMVCQYC